MSIQTIEKVILSQTQANMNPGEEIIFDLDPNECALLNGKGSYLQFTVELSGDFKCSLDGLAGGHSVLSRIQVWNRAGDALIENLENPALYIGQRWYNAKTEGLQNKWKLFEGKNNDDYTRVDPLESPYFENSINNPYNATPQFNKVQCCLPLYQSGVFFSEKAFPVIACDGVQLRLFLAPARQAITALRTDGFVVQRDLTDTKDATGTASTANAGGLLQSLPYDTNQATGANEPGVSQFLPQLYELAVHTGNVVSSLPALTGEPTDATKTAAPLTNLATTVAPSAGTGLTLDVSITQAFPAAADLLAQITQQTVGAANAVYPGVATTVLPAGGAGCTLDITIAGGVCTVCTVNAEGAGYGTGDVITVANALIGGGGTDLEITTDATNYTSTAAPVAINTPGIGYAENDVLTVAMALIPGATADLVVGQLTAGNFTATTNEVVVQGLGGAVGVCTQTGLTNLRENVLATVSAPANVMQCAGQSLYYTNDDGTLTSCGEIESIEATAGNTTTFTMTEPFTGGNADPAKHPAVFAVIGTGDSASYTLSDLQLVVSCVEPGAQYYNAMMNKVKSKGGFSIDIKSFNLYRTSLQKENIVNQSTIPMTENRAKAVVMHTIMPVASWNNSFIQPLNNEMSSYQYQIRNSNVPDRVVNTDKEFDVDNNTWNNLADHERFKALGSSKIMVRSQEHPSGFYLTARQLAKRGYSFSATAQGSVRLTQNFGNTRDVGGVVNKSVLPMFNTNMLTFVHHFRKISMAPNNVVVSY